MTPHTLVLVHGGWCGAWAWEKVVPELERRGIEVDALDLPRTSLEADADAVRDALDRATTPVVVCGHSYGGAAMTLGAAAHPAADRLVYLAAFMPDTGESVSDIMSSGAPSELVESMRFADDGTSCTLDSDGVRSAAFADCAPEETDVAVARLVSHHLDCFTSPLPAAAWHDVPSTYVIAENDRSIDPVVQRRLASRATDAVTVPTGHFPQLARPDLVVEILASAAHAPLRSRSA